MAKEPVCCCGHEKSSHWNGNTVPQKWTHCTACQCLSFTDKRISARRAASKSTREAGPKSDIIKLLEERKIRFFRLQSGDIVGRAGGKGKAWKVKGCKPGTPDLMIILSKWVTGEFTPIISGRFFATLITWIEVKKSDGKPSKEQVAFREQAEALGETYLLAKSKEDVENWLNSNL